MVEFRKPNVVLTMVDSVVTRGLLQVLSTGELVGKQRLGDSTGNSSHQEALLPLFVLLILHEKRDSRAILKRLVNLKFSCQLDNGHNNYASWTLTQAKRN